MNARHSILLAATLLTIGTAGAQTAPTSGTITYETMRRIDLANLRINVNGQEVRPGGTLPNGGTFNPPETIEGEEIFQFAGTWAKREPMARGGNRFMMMRGGPGSGPGGEGGAPGPPPTPSPDMARQRERMRNIRFPLDETQYTDLTTGKAIQMISLRVDSTRREHYRSEVKATRPADWQVTSKTKKILGYTCQRATCTVKEQPCTVWFTTELPFTFSPAPAFTPDRGVVLWIESDELMYRATKLTAGPVDVAQLTPDPTAKTVSDDELRDIRRKAMANFRQQNGMQVRVRD